MDLKTVYADEQGNIVDAPKDFIPLVRQGEELVILKAEDLIPLPKSADLMCLPSHMPLATYQEEILPITGHTVVAILPSGYIINYLPAYKLEEEMEEEALPNYPFAPVVAYKDELYVAAQRLKGSLDNPFQQYNAKNLAKLIKQWKKNYAKNKLVEYIGALALEDRVYNAQDLFYQRGEVAIPLGKKKIASGWIQAEHYPRCTELKFNPSGAEIAQVGVAHLALDNILTLGEDMLEDVVAAEERLSNALKKIRNKTNKGKINLYTIGVATESIANLADDLDCLTIHLATAIKEDYSKFYGEEVAWEMVEATLNRATEKGLPIILKIPYLPGYTDGKMQRDNLLALLNKFNILGIVLDNAWLNEEIINMILAGELDEAIGYKDLLKDLKEVVPVASDLMAVLKEGNNK